MNVFKEIAEFYEFSGSTKIGEPICGPNCVSTPDNDPYNVSNESLTFKVRTIVMLNRNLKLLTSNRIRCVRCSTH